MSNTDNTPVKSYLFNEVMKLKNTPIFEPSRFLSYDWDTHKDAEGTPKHVIVGINLVDDPYFDGSRSGGHTMCYAIGVEDIIGEYTKGPLTKEYVSNVICRRIQDAYKRWQGDPNCVDSRHERKLVVEHFRVIREFTPNEVQEISKTAVFANTKYLHWRWDLHAGTVSCYVNCYLNAMLDIYQEYTVNVGQLEGWSAEQIQAFIEMAVTQRTNVLLRDNPDIEDYSGIMLENIELHFDKLKEEKTNGI